MQEGRLQRRWEMLYRNVIQGQQMANKSTDTVSFVAYICYLFIKLINIKF